MNNDLKKTNNYKISYAKDNVNNNIIKNYYSNNNLNHSSNYRVEHNYNNRINKYNKAN